MRTSSLESLHLENFKGFKDTGKLKLSKINIIVGKNSSGKSSLLKSLIASSQSVFQEQVDSSDFRLVGKNTDLGTFRDTIHRGNIEDKFSIKFGHSFKPPRGWYRNHDHLMERAEWRDLDPHSFELKYSYKAGDEAYSARISNVEISKNGKKLFSSRGIAKKISARRVTVNPRTSISTRVRNNVGKLTHVKYHGDVDIQLEEWAKYVPNKEIEYEGRLELPFNLKVWSSIDSPITRFEFEDLKDEIKALQKKSKEEIILLENQVSTFRDTIKTLKLNEKEFDESVVWKEEESVQFHEATARLRQYTQQQLEVCLTQIKDLENILKKDESELIEERIKTRFKDRNIDSKRIHRIDIPGIDEIRYACRILQDRILNNISYLGPIREEPLRQSILAQSSGMVSGKKGSDLAGILHSNLQKPDFKADFDNYLQKLDIADSIETIEDTRDNIPVGYINILINSGNKSSSLVDVGFGTSQVLPVIFELMAHRKKIIVIEQPELHLHPSAQAELGNLLKDSILRDNQLFIETHSINLIERLRRLMRKGELNSKDVRLIYVNKDRDGDSHCTQIGFLSDGSLDSPWPEKDFFGERKNEVMSDR